MRTTISLVSGIVAILASLVLVASLGAPWYRSEIIPFAAGQEFAVTDFSGWRALSFIDIVLVLAAAAAAVLVLVGLVLSMRQPLLASAFFGAIAVVLVVYRMVDQPLAEEISKISDEQGFGLRWGIWMALAAAVVLTAAATCAVRTTSSEARSVVAAAPPV